MPGTVLDLKSMQAASGEICTIPVSDEEMKSVVVVGVGDLPEVE